MLSLSPQTFPAFNWPVVEEVTSKENDNYCANYKEHEGFFHLTPKVDLDNSPQSTTVSGDPNAVKKLNHNASERDRRKKMNCLYSTLRSLLLDVDHTKKLSIPATISHALKYIPELQKQVERLEEKKEELISKISWQGDLFNQGRKRKRPVQSSMSTVSTSLVEDSEIVVQISANKLQKCSLSDVLLLLEEEGLFLINASSSESFGGRVFYNLHLQVETICILDCEALNEKLLSLYDRS